MRHNRLLCWGVTLILIGVIGLGITRGHSYRKGFSKERWGRAEQGICQSCPKFDDRRDFDRRGPGAFGGGMMREGCWYPPILDKTVPTATINATVTP